MGKKMTAFALAALLVLGLSGCGSGNNATTDRSYGSRGTYGNGTNGSYSNGTNGSYGNGTNGSYGNGTYNNGTNRGTTWNGTDSDGLMDDIGDGIGGAMEDAGDAIRNAGNTLTGNRTRYEQMLENGRVHDTDGYLLDGENRHD